MNSVNDSIGVLVACMPKSGSTYLSSLITNIPGFRREHIVPGYQRREQEICVKKLEQAYLKTEFMRECWRKKQLVATERPRGFVTQMHVRYTAPTAEIIKTYNLSSILLVRNIFDVIASLADHLRDSSPFMAMAYVSEDMRTMPEPEMHRFIADMAIPWYINFYRGWCDCDNRKLVTYDQLINEPLATLSEIAEFAHLNVGMKKLKTAVEQTGSMNTRLNKGVSGRGAALDGYVIDRVRQACRYYPDIDFSVLGVD